MQNIKISEFDFTSIRPIDSMIQVWHPFAKLVGFFNGDLIDEPVFQEGDTVVAIWRPKPSTIDQNGKLNLTTI